MERDDTGTFARLRAVRTEVFDPAISGQGGRIVKTAGDGLLAEFGSALAALRAAVQVQREMAAHNAGASADKRIDYRIGVNLGDIIIDGDDIAGDGVNVASRLETLAEPGGICVSTSVREQVHDDLGTGFVDIGEQQVKNIERPIRVYRVVLGNAEAGASLRKGAGKRRGPTRGWGWMAGIVAVMVVGLSALLAATFWHSAPPDAAAPPALSIAILPFAAPSGNAVDQQFADGLTRDLTTGLGAWHWATVAAHALVANMHSKTVDVRALGRELNVRYVLTGEVRREADEFVVTAQLIQTATGNQVWSDRLRYDSLQPGAGKAVPRVQLTKRLRRALADAERRRAAALAAGSTPMDLVLRGEAIDFSSRGMKDTLEARALYAEALRLNENFVPALVRLAESYDGQLEDNPTPDRVANKKEIDSPDQPCHCARQI